MITLHLATCWYLRFFFSLCSWLEVCWAPVNTPALTVSSLGQEASQRFALPASGLGGAVKQENFLLSTSG